MTISCGDRRRVGVVPALPAPSGAAPHGGAVQGSRRRCSRGQDRVHVLHVTLPATVRSSGSDCGIHATVV